MKEILNGFSGWKIILKQNKAGREQIELRKNYNPSSGAHGDLLLIVASDGFDYKGYSTTDSDRLWTRLSLGLNIHISTNGPIHMTFDDWAELNTIIERCKDYLESDDKFSQSG